MADELNKLLIIIVIFAQARVHCRTHYIVMFAQAHVHCKTYYIVMFAQARVHCRTDGGQLRDSDVLIGYHSDTAASIILRAWENHVTPGEMTQDIRSKVIP